MTAPSFSWTLRNSLLALLHLVVLVAVALYLHRFAWLGLFGAILLPVLCATLLLPLWQRLFGAMLGWTGTWTCLLVANAVGAAVALPLYHLWSAAFAPGRLPD